MKMQKETTNKKNPNLDRYGIVKECVFYGVILSTPKDGKHVFNVNTGKSLTIFNDRPSPYIKILGTDGKQYKITVAEVVLRCWASFGMPQYIPSKPHHEDGDKCNNHIDNLSWEPSARFQSKIDALENLIIEKRLSINIPWGATEENIDRIHKAILQYADTDREGLANTLLLVLDDCKTRWSDKFRKIYELDHNTHLDDEREIRLSVGIFS